MRSLGFLSLSALWLGHAIASPVVLSIGEDDDDIVLNVHGNHRIVINEIAETAACSGDETSRPHRLEAGPGASPPGLPDTNRPGVGSGVGPAGGPVGGSPTGSPATKKPSPPASQPTVLVPACDPTLDRSSLDHLLLSTKQDFYYTQKDIGSGSGTVATVKIPQLVYPAVQLQVSSAIQRVTCTSNAAQIHFNNQDAYLTALENWGSAYSFILVVYGEDCGSGYAVGEQDYLVVTSVTGDGSSTITASVTVTDFEGAVGRETVVTIDIGIFNPTNGTDGFTVVPGTGNNTTGGTTGAGSGDAGDGGGGDGAPLASGFDKFDEELDNQIGFVTVDDPDFDAQFFPSPATSITRHRRAANRDNGFHIEKRWFGSDIWNKFKNSAQTAEEKAKQALTRVVTFFKDAKDRLEGEALKALAVVSRFTSVNKQLSGQYGLNYYPSNTDTRWGRAYKLYEKDSVSAYCVGCGVNGQVTLSGSVSFTIANGFTSGAISANGNLHGVAQLGVVANIVKNFDLKEQVIAQAALSDLVLGGVLTIGPAIKLSAGANLGFEASGSLLAGVTLDWPAISATVDIINSANSKTDGFRPDVIPGFQAEGSVTASVTPYVKVSLEFTFGLLQGRFSRSLALVDKPSITATANVAAQAGLTDDQITGSFTNGCKGVLVGGTFRNQVYVDIFGISTKTLLDYTSDPISRCLGTPVRRALLARQGLIANSTEPTISIMQSIDGNFDLHAGEDGNIYSISSSDATDPVGDDSQDTSSQFQAFGTAIIADSNSRILHGYADTLNNFGVSRLRFSPASAIPQTARVMAIDPSQNPDGGDSLGIHVARDTATNVFHLATCVYDTKYPKVFLIAANNVDSGLKRLESNDADMVKSVTGGRIKQCGLLAYADGYSKY